MCTIYQKVDLIRNGIWYTFRVNKTEQATKLIPLFSWLFSPYDQIIGNSTLPAGMRALRDQLFGKEKVIVHGLTEKTTKILESMPIVIVCNHPFDSEVILLLGSLPNRKDVTMVGSESQVKMGHQFAKYILKVYTFRQEQEGKNPKLSARVAKYTYRKSSGLSQEKMKQHNREIIKKAASKVNKGEMVVMFPQGTSSKIEWRPGIGYLVSQLAFEKPTFICMAYIANSSNADFLRMIPGLNNILLRPAVTFSKPELFSKEILPSEPKMIASYLEKKYLSWIKTLD
jgi:hypothetical protein